MSLEETSRSIPILVISLATLVSCLPITDSDSFYSPWYGRQPAGEEDYRYQPHYEELLDDFYPADSYRYPEHYRQSGAGGLPHYHHHRAQAIAYMNPDMVAFENQEEDMHHPYPSHEEFFGEILPPFQPDARQMQFENPFKNLIEEGKKQVEQSMSEAGKQMTEMAEAHTEEMGKQMQQMMEEAGAANGTSLPKLPRPPGLPSSRQNTKDPAGEKASSDPTKKDGEGDKDKTKKEEGEDPLGNNPFKKMLDAGSEMMKKIPEGMPTPSSKAPVKLMAEYAGIKDETTEAHDEDAELIPSAKRGEWGAPRMFDVRRNPGADYFDYYEGPY